MDAYVRHRRRMEKLMGKHKNLKAVCFVYMRPKKKNKWGVFNSITKSEFIFKKKKHAYLVAKCLNIIYGKNPVDIPE